MPKGKPEPQPEPEPVESREDRQRRVDEASSEFIADVVAFARDRELSSAEAFAIVTSTLHELAQLAMKSEHEEFFESEAKDEKE